MVGILDALWGSGGRFCRDGNFDLPSRHSHLILVGPPSLCPSPWTGIRAIETHFLRGFAFFWLVRRQFSLFFSYTFAFSIPGETPLKNGDTSLGANQSCSSYQKPLESGNSIWSITPTTVVPNGLIENSHGSTWRTNYGGHSSLRPLTCAAQQLAH